MRVRWYDTSNALDAYDQLHAKLRLMGALTRSESARVPQGNGALCREGAGLAASRPFSACGISQHQGHVSHLHLSRSDGPAEGGLGFLTRLPTGHLTTTGRLEVKY